MALSFYERVSRLLRSGRVLAIVTVVQRRGSAPRDFGAKMIVTENGEIEFSVGGGAFEALVIEDAREAIRKGCGFEKDYRFSEQGENALGMVCGGSARVLFEVIRPPVPLFVFGAGHVGREVAHLGIRLEFDVTLVDDRPRFLNPRRHPEGLRMVRVEHDFSEGLPQIPAGAFVVIVTRCHRTDLAVLRHAADRGAAYLGMIGSRRKVAVVKARAVALGVSEGALTDLRAPIGLAIGAETPEEIAVSVAAEMIPARRAALGLAGQGATITHIAPGRQSHRVRPAGSRTPFLRPGS